MSDQYILDSDGEPVACDDIVKWGDWLRTAERHVGQDLIGDVRVSTVFLGIDHSFHAAGPPILWETMIFGGKHDSYQERYSTRADAIKGHAAAVALVKDS